MGVIFLEHIGGTRLFSCASCDTNLTNRGQLISTRFTGATGRAFLFNKVVNLNYRLVIVKIIFTESLIFVVNFDIMNLLF